MIQYIVLIYRMMSAIILHERKKNNRRRILNEKWFHNPFLGKSKLRHNEY